MNPNDHEPPALDDPRVVAALDEYLAALEAGARPDRAAFLARHAAIAEPLAECLDGLEVLHAASDGGPGSQASSGGGTGGPAWPTGMPLGDFRIRREVGRGGMGVVYEAEQLSLGRRIALKVLPLAATLDPRQLQRFKNEARAAAHLHHPHIVPVYAVGCERGVHFYAMQYIEGRSLAQVIGELRAEGKPPPPPNPLPPKQGEGGPIQDQLLAASRVGVPSPLPPLRGEGGRGGGGSPTVIDSLQRTPSPLSASQGRGAANYFRHVAQLGVQAAEALAHAHAFGVVHRDVKPANLLVDGHGHLWVTDFGLAQFQNDAGLTQTGDLLGTLRYMSPEQAGGQHVPLDPRTDVYSLGATLYELLTLRPPFTGADRPTLLRQILHDEPRPPRALAPAIPADLETIVLKALGKTPDERYARVQDLADDLRRFLNDQPIRARRPSPLEKATKWARRHRGVVASAVAALGLTAAGLAVAFALTTRAYDRERLKAQEADQSFRQARQAVDQFARIAEEELAGNPLLEGTRRRLLEAALAYYQDFLDQRSDDPSIQQELEASRARVQAIIAELTTLMGANKYVPLHQREVQDELQLNADQRGVIGRMVQRWGETFRDFDRMDAAERDRRRLELAREQEAEMVKLLTPAQLQRLRQIALQWQGPAAFREPEVVAALKLTPEQRDRIRALEVDFFIRFDRPPGGPHGGRPRGPGLTLESPVEKILALLTEEQRGRWKVLTGAPFQGGPWCFPIGGPGPHGGPHEPRERRPPDLMERRGPPAP